MNKVEERFTPEGAAKFRKEWNARAEQMERKEKEWRRYFKEVAGPAGRRGQWWYHELNRRHDLEKKHLGKGISIRVETGEYVIAKTAKDAFENAKKRFGVTAFFTALLSPYHDRASLHTVERGKARKRGWFDTVKQNRLFKEGECLYALYREELEKKYLGKVVFVDIRMGKYVIGETVEEAEKKARELFPSPITGGFYKVGGGSLVFPY